MLRNIRVLPKEVNLCWEIRKDKFLIKYTTSIKGHMHLTRHYFSNPPLELSTFNSATEYY